MKNSQYRTLIKSAKGSSLGRWIWIAVFLTVSCCCFAFGLFTSAVQEDSEASIPWSAAIVGNISQDAEKEINSYIDAENQAVAYVAYGDFSKVSSDTVTKTVDGTEDDDDDLSGRLSDLYPQYAPAGGGDTIQSFQIVSTYGSNSAYANPWFSEEQLVEGTLESSNPVVVDANIAAEFDLHPGSKVTVSISTNGTKGKRVKAAETLVVTGIVRPTKRFCGISAYMSKIAKALEEGGAASISAAYVYGMDATSAAGFVDSLNAKLPEGISATLPSTEVANMGVTSTVDTAPYSPWYWVASVVALAVALILACLDAKRTGEALAADGGEFVARHVLEGVLFWLLTCLVAVVILWVFVVPGSIYYIWYLPRCAYAFVAVAILGAVAVAVLRFALVRRSTSNVESA